MIEAAVNGRADGIVTFNLSDFVGSAKQFGIEVVRPGDAVQQLEKAAFCNCSRLYLCCGRVICNPPSARLVGSSEKPAAGWHRIGPSCCSCGMNSKGERNDQ
jgi:hypothetical protein